MKLVYMLPFFINNSSQYFNEELKIAKDCLQSLSLSNDVKLIIYNQGSLTNSELTLILSNYSNIDFDIIGSGVNVGIPKSRYKLVNYLLENYSDTRYVAEIHLDMIFPPNWAKPLITYLEEHDDPIISPRILRKINNKFYLQDNGTEINFAGNLEDKTQILQSLTEKSLVFNFVHPVIHKLEALRSIHYYDPGFLTGHQNFEDTSILIGYRYYMGTRSNWKPKCYWESCVFHQIEGQRLNILNTKDPQKNLDGLIRQYGAYGIYEWYAMDGNPFWLNLFNQLIVDKSAYE